MPTRLLRCRARASSFRAARSSPSTRIVPPVGRSRPATTLRSVDLPEPDGPITATNSPRRIPSVTRPAPRRSHGPTNRCVRGQPPRRRAVHSLWSSLPDACDHPRVRVVKPEMRKPTRSVAEIFSGDVDSFTTVGGEHSTDLRLCELHVKCGARDHLQTHTHAP